MKPHIPVLIAALGLPEPVSAGISCAIYSATQIRCINFAPPANAKCHRVRKYEPDGSPPATFNFSLSTSAYTFHAPDAGWWRFYHSYAATGPTGGCSPTYSGHGQHAVERK